jgi:hypothetical protein
MPSQSKMWGNINFRTNVDIQRSDGRVHPAVVSGFNQYSNTIIVEWKEGEKTKQKTIGLAIIKKLNPQLFPVESKLVPGTRFFVFSRKYNRVIKGFIVSLNDNKKLIEVGYFVDGKYYEKPVDLDKARKLNPHLFPVESKTEVAEDCINIKPCKPSVKEAGEAGEDQSRKENNIALKKERLIREDLEREFVKVQEKLSAATAAATAALAAAALAGLWRLLTRG